MEANLFWNRVDENNPYRTIKQLAAACGLDYNRVKRNRSDVRFPNLEDAYVLAFKEGVSLEYLLTGTDSFSEAQRIVARDREMEDLVIYLSSHETAKKGLVEAFSLKKASAAEIVG